MSSSVLEYWELEGLEHINLVDSYVTKIIQMPTFLDFYVDFALRKSHRAYTTPKPDEAHCYREGKIRFANPADLVWKRVNVQPMSDPDGSVDLGSMDYVNLDPDTGLFEVGGGGVQCRFKSEMPVVELFALEET